MDELANFNKLPLTIVTGFLGSGKTTLLNHILKNANGLRIGVLVNELGDIDIDSQLLVSLDENQIELTNGCICCTLNEDLVQAVYNMLQKRSEIDYLIVETTGVADPLPVILTFLGTELRDLTQLDAILTVVDAETILDPRIEDIQAIGEQIVYGDIVLLNKTDLVAAEQLMAAKQKIDRIKPDARIINTQKCQVPLSALLNLHSDNFGSQTLAIDDEMERHLQNDGFMTVSFQSNRSISLKKFQQFLDYQLPSSILRMKGIMWFKESNKCHIFQLSGKRFSIEDREWMKQPSNQIVCIGRNLDKLQIYQLLTNCLT
jgi:G3E family GTPase